jgi:hypothetical protein
MNTISIALKDVLTGVDGQSYAIVKLLGMLIVLVFLGLTIASFWTGKVFDMVGFGTGAGLAIASMGAAIKLTESSEPKDKA